MGDVNRKGNRSTFSNSAIAIGGKGIGLLIGTIGFMVLSRILAKETLGHYFTINSYVTFIGAVYFFGYSHAVCLMKKVEVVVLSKGFFLIFTGLFLLASPGIFFFEHFIEISSILFLSIVMLMLSNIYVRDEEFVKLSLVTIGVSVVFYGLFAVVYFSFGGSLTSLLWARIGGLFLAIIAAIISLKGYGKYTFSLKRLSLVFYKYRRFPFLVAPGVLFMSVTQQTPIMLAASFSTSEVVADYTLGNMLVMMPMRLLGDTIQGVYRGRLATKIRNGDDIYEGFLQVVLCLFVLSALVTIGVWVGVPVAVEFLLDEKWRTAVPYIHALLPYLFSMILASPLTAIFLVNGMQQYILVNHFGGALIAILAFGYGCYIGNFLLGCQIFSILMAIRFGLILAVLVRVVKRGSIAAND